MRDDCRQKKSTNLSDWDAEVGELLRKKLSSVRDALKKALPDSVTIAFRVTGGFDGDWLLIANNGLSLRFAKCPWPDCLIELGADDLQELLAGRLDGAEGFRNGRLKIQGDVGLIMTIERILAEDASSELSPV